MKTGIFEYTDKAVVDSSLVQAVYYNRSNYTLALEFHGFAPHPSVFYAAVPYSVFEGLTEKTDSVGRAYNMFVKNKFQNISDGTVYGVNYHNASDVEAAPLTAAEPIQGEKEASDLTYRVQGYIRVSGEFDAANRHAAIGQFLDSLTEDGYDEEDLAVTEVEIVG